MGTRIRILGRDMWWGRRRLFTPASLLVLTLATILGLSSYLYLPLAAWHKPLDSWGDQTNLDGFLTHFLRREYGVRQSSPAHDRTKFHPLALLLLLGEARLRAF